MTPSFVPEVLLPWPKPPTQVPPATFMRSTMIRSSLETLHESGHYARYLERLDPNRRDEIIYCVAGVWLEMPLAELHYRACDELGLTSGEQLELFRASGTRSIGTALGTAVKLAKVAGATPWTLLGQLDRMYVRACQGGAVSAGIGEE